jgi:hypothetical protein
VNWALDGESDADALVVMTGTDLGPQWSGTEPREDMAYGMALDAIGVAWVTGTTEQADGFHLFLAELSRDSGDELWSYVSPEASSLGADVALGPMPAPSKMVACGVVDGSAWVRAYDLG